MSSTAAHLHRWHARWLSDTPLIDTHPAAHRIREVVATVTRGTVPTIAAPVLLVLICAALQLGPNNGSARAPLVVAVVISVLLAAPLAWRTAYPLTVFAVIAVVALVQWVVDVRLVADVALLVAVYTVAARYPPRVGWTVAAVVEVGAVLAVFRWEVAPDRFESLALLTGPLAAAVFAGIAVRGRRSALVAAVERGERLERERHQEAVIELAAERTRIAREMHDVVAHGLSLMVTMSDAAVMKQSSDPAQATSAMRQVAASGRDALGDMRTLLGVLRPDDEQTGRRPQPGLAGLDALVNQVRETGLNVELRTTGEHPAMGHGVQLTIYRIVQEALTNVIKHAHRPSRVEVTLAHHPEKTVIQVVDDGESADAIAREAVPTTGFGLAGMSERAALHGGWVTADHGPVRGWRVVAVIPMEAEAR